MLQANQLQKKSYPRIVWLLFFLSGTCSLIYEVIWSHELSLIFGNTVYSLSAVLTAFMGGLALGSYLAGRFIARINRPLRFYGTLEIAIGIYCALLPLLFNGAESIFQIIYNHFGASFYLLTSAKFLMSLLLLLIPTTFMGATLPILAEALLHRRDSMGFTTGTLYAFNTFGAVAGTVGAGFLLIPVLGIQSTILTAALANVILGFFAISLEKKLKPVKSERDQKEAKKVTDLKSMPVSDKAVKVAVLVFALSGFAAMVSQIGWTRVLSLAIAARFMRSALLSPPLFLA